VYFYKNSDRYAQKSKFITEKTKTVVNNVTMFTNKSMFTMAGLHHRLDHSAN